MGALQWLAGLYYYKEGYQQPVFTTLFDQAQLGSPASSPPCRRSPARSPPTPCCGPTTTVPELHDESYAGFGQIDWKFAPEWKTTLGLRYSHDHKYGSEDVRLVCFAVTSCLGGATPEGLGSLAPPVDVTAAVVNLAVLCRRAWWPVAATA